MIDNNKLPLRNKVAIITGAGTGIGRACAIRLAQEGARVCIADINSKKGNETANLIQCRGNEAFFQHVNVSDEDTVAQCMKQTFLNYGRIDFLINNAVVFIFGHLGAIGQGSGTFTDREVEKKDWDNILSVNVLGYANCIKHASKYIRKNRIPNNSVTLDFGKGKSQIKTGSRGAIVNIGSVSSYIAQAEFLPYNATKAAILSMTRCTALDFAKDKIRVNCICPGTIETMGSYGHMEKINLSIDEGRKEFGKCNAMKRQGAPEEIASVVFFLCSEDSSFITGVHIPVDGGQTFN